MATPFHLPVPFGVLTDDQALPYLVGSEPYSTRYQPVCGYQMPTTRLLLARIVLRVDILDTPRANAVNLDYCLLPGFHKVAGSDRHHDETACTHGHQLPGVECVPHPEVNRAREHGQVLDRRMRMRRNLEAGGKLQPHREGAGLAGLALDNRQRRPPRQGW